MSEVNLIDRLGGRRMVSRIAEELCVEMLLDDRLSEPCRGMSLSAMVRTHRCMLVGLLAGAASGPAASDHPAAGPDAAPMLADPAARARAAATLSAVVDLLRNALHEAGVDPELSAQVVARIVRCRQEIKE
ncbi:MAG: hypothetical protein KF911_02910 [Pseudomonadales bacterium]|nr:hypothetical protein [Pseudomonadales bacterium]